MSFINTATRTYIYINNEDVSEYLIQGSLSDDSVYSSTIVTTRGQIVLGTNELTLDFNKTIYPIGSKVNIWIGLDNGEIALHPKGTLYVINSNVSVEEKTLTLEVGCSLAFISDKEDQYQSAIETLFDDMFTAEEQGYFDIEEKKISVLSALLEVNGQVIYQDPYGNIQKLNAFGDDGLGASLLPAKLTSFDKYSAISIESISDSSFENGVSSVTVETTIDTRKRKEDDEDPPEDPTRPEPLITSVVQRTIEVPSTTGYINLTRSPRALTSQSNPITGTSDEPQPSSGSVGYDYRIDGSMETGSQLVKERVTSGRYVRYSTDEGEGNQVVMEQSWEHCSAGTWASSAISNSLNQVITHVNNLINECNGLLQKANQWLDLRDEQIKKGKVGSSDYYYALYKAQAFLARADYLWSLIQEYVTAGNSLVNSYTGIYGLASASTTEYSYGKAGETLMTVTSNYLPPISWDSSEAAEIQLNGYLLQVQYLSISEVGVPNGEVSFFTNLGLKLASQSVKTYQYDTLYTTETEVFEDYQNPQNNFIAKRYSSSGSSNADQSDRIIDLESVDGKGYCNVETEQEELKITVPVQGDLSVVTAGWFGAPKAYEKVVSFPLEFAPMLPKYNSTTRSCSSISGSGRKSTYENILKKYAIILAKKISGDNRGFRITEKMRAEIFEYYPFYPVNISCESVSRAFTARVSASNWVFDSQNAVCSFDCLLTGAIDDPVFASPSHRSFYLKTEGNYTFNSNSLKLPSTTSSIAIITLPANGQFELSNVAVSVGDQITKADIDSGLLVFVPDTGDTTNIEFTYEAKDSSGETISSDENIYPVFTSVIITPENYAADGGEFTLNVSNNGFDCDGGNLDSGASLGGPAQMNAGDFDTGTTITLPTPPIPQGTPSGNNSADPETDFGIAVKDGDDNVIDSDDLPVSEGGLDAVFDVLIDASAILNIFAEFNVNIIENLGWDYGYISVKLGTDFDFGTISSPNSYDADFGSIATANEPVLQSSVV